MATLYPASAAVAGDLGRGGGVGAHWIGSMETIEMKDPRMQDPTASPEALGEKAVRRHGDLWLMANIRAVKAITDAGIKSWKGQHRQVAQLAILAALDQARLARGYEWHGEGPWKKTEGKSCQQT